VYRASVLNGKAGVEFVTAGNKVVTTSFLDSSFDTSLSVYGVVATANAALQVWISNQSDRLYCGSLNEVITTQSNLSTPQTILNTMPTTGYLHAFRYDGSTQKLAVYDPTNQYTAVSQSSSGNTLLSGAFTIGDFSAGGFTWNGQVLEVLAYNRTLTDAEHLVVTEYLRGKYALDYSATQQIKFDGNSLTAGNGASGPSFYYPTQCVALLAGSWDYTNLGVPGQTTTQRAADAQVQIKNKYGSHRSRNVAVLWELTNDLTNTQNAATVISDFSSWCSDVRSAGYKVVAVTCLPRSNGGLYANFETDRQTVNTSIRANYTSYADALADVAADNRIGDFGDSDDTTYYDADKTHLNDTGYAIVASIVATAIQTL
jgi:lysophospholipase L1-like esterase